MSNFAEAMADNPPRLVVLYRRGGDGSDQFQWGVVGALPVLTVIGHIVGVQSDIVSQLAEQYNECPEVAFVMVWSGDGFEWFVHRDIPVAPLVGMLECIKTTLVMSRMGQHAAADKVQLLGPDGKPMRV